jgi:hypothetical protein
VSGQLHSRGNIPQYPLDRRLGGPQSLSERGSEEKEPLLLQGIEPRSFIFIQNLIIEDTVYDKESSTYGKEKMICEYV